MPTGRSGVPPSGPAMPVIPTPMSDPNARRAPETPAVTLTVGETRTINLVFGARGSVEDVEITVELPAGVELAAHPGEHRVTARAALAAGDTANTNANNVGRQLGMDACTKD